MSLAFTRRKFSKFSCPRGSPRDTPKTRKNPIFGAAKKPPLPRAKNPLFLHLLHEKCAFSTNFGRIVHKNEHFFADIAPRPCRASPQVKNPPIYTVLNAAFSAPGPPRPWHRGGTPVPDAFAQAPDARFRPNALRTFSETI